MLPVGPETKMEIPVYVLRLVYWAQFAAITIIAVGLLFAISGILASFPHPDFMVFALQLFVIAIDVWILWHLMRPHVKDVFAARRHHTAARVEA